VIIRTAKSEDASSLAHLASSLGRPQDAVTFSRDVSVYSEGFFIAEVEGTFLGYLIMRTESAPNGVQGRSPIQLWRLFVSPEYQGKGVATRLISQAVSYARAKQHDVIWLGTSADNARAIALYRRSGFHHVGDALLHQGHGDHEDLIMCCNTE
jgi:ribosomal protein S18 acetylase RimI-like enzyme